MQTTMARIGIGLLLAMAAAGCYRDARADEDQTAGAQYSCDSKAHVFDLLAYDHAIEGVPGFPLKAGYKEIPQGAPPFVCALGPVSLRLVVSVYPPSNGQGMGSGYVEARSMSASNVELLPDSPAFDGSPDSSQPVLIRVRVTAKEGAVRVERCYQEDSDQQSPAERCESKEVPVAALAAAQAESLRPADLATQRERSATKVPPELDYARAFVAHDQSGIPVCAHLASSFLHDRSGRIAGAPGDRVYIRPANPQVCDVSVDSKCQGKAYLIPGDRVEVGFICGAWTYIEYRPLTRATDSILGWVPTTGLYDVDSSTSTLPPGKHATTAAAVNSHAALRQLAGLNRIDEIESNADRSGQLQAVRDLPALVQRAIDAGAAVNQRDSDGQNPLVDTFRTNNVDVAQVLLKAGADPNAQVGEISTLMSAMGSYSNHHDTTMVLQLLQAGAAVNFRTAGDYSAPDDGDGPNACCPDAGQTALTLAAQGGELALVKILLAHGADASLPRSDGALPADIARSEHHPAVAALIDQYAKSKAVAPKSATPSTTAPNTAAH